MLEQNYYATIFRDAWYTGSYLLKNLKRLEKATKDFHRAFHVETTLPDYVVDAIASNMTVTRSPTCFQIENGILAEWEGCCDMSGCCHGNCTHVWKAQTMGFQLWSNPLVWWNSTWKRMKPGTWLSVQTRYSAGTDGNSYRLLMARWERQ